MRRGGSAPGERRGGRQKGTPNRMTRTLKELILGALDDAGGQQYLMRMAEQQPAAFLALIGRVLPTTITGDAANPVQTVTRIELIAVEPPPRAPPVGAGAIAVSTPALPRPEPVRHLELVRSEPSARDID
jgi:hypothetical protein